MALAVAPLAADEAPKDPPKPLAPAQLYKQSLPSALALKVKYADETEGSGSGFLAVKDGCAITAWHMVRNARSVTAKFSDGEEFEASGVVDKDEKRDLALIRVKVAARPLLALTPADPEVGARAYVIGAPRGLEFSLSDGLISQIRTEEGVKSYQFSCPISPGNSGGPLLLENGQVAGVVNALRVDGQNLNFAVPSVYALGLDATLPTKPWDQLVVTKDPAKPVAPPSQMELADALLLAYAAVLDLPEAISRLEDEVVSVPGAYKGGVPTYLSLTESWASQSWIDLSDLADRKISNPMIIPLREALRLFMDTADLYTKALDEAKKQQGWTKEANEFLTQGRSMWRSAIAAHGAVNAVFDGDQLPKEMQTLLLRSWAVVNDDVLDDMRWEMGIVMLASNPMVIFRIKPEGWARKLDLQAGDQIVSVDKAPVNSLYQMKKLLEKKVGDNVLITVLRNEKEETLSRKVPPIKKSGKK